MYVYIGCFPKNLKEIHRRKGENNTDWCRTFEGGGNSYGTKGLVK